MSERVHPLNGFQLNVCDFKCFGPTGSGYFDFEPITVVIGKNNAGKSSILDLIEECAAPDQTAFKPETRRSGRSPVVFVKSAPSEALLDQNFRKGEGGGDVPSNNHFAFSRRFLGVELDWQFNENRAPLLNPDCISERDRSTGVINRLSASISFPFEGLWVRRVAAERDVKPEQALSDRTLRRDGSGLTNLVRSFLLNQDLQREAVEKRLLADINYIYHLDHKFERISTKLNEATQFWEVFLTEEGGRETRLSQSGTSLRSIFIILAYLHLSPDLTPSRYTSRMIFCIEEPENNLHPALLRRLLQLIAQNREAGSYSLLITTHSPICIDWASSRSDTSILHVRKEGEDSRCFKVSDHLGKVGILDDLDVRGSDILQSNGVIWVEGPSDRIYLKKWLDVGSGGTVKEGTHYSFMYYGGKILAHFCVLPVSELSKRISLMKMNRNVALVIDSDRRPTANGKRKARMHLNETKKRIIEEVTDAGGFVWVTIGKEVENYVTTVTWKKVSKESIEIADEYVDIPALTGLTQAASTKVELAYLASAHMNSEEVDDHLDLREKVATLLTYIRGWNRD